MQDIQTENLEFESGHFSVPAYMARPDDKAVHPGIVTIQEFWGLVPHIKDVAERFARQGFVVLAPDLYHGKSAVEPDEARKLAMELDRERAVSEIRSAIQYLQSLDTISPKKIGVVGWCMGGGLAIATAAQSEDLGAVVAYYGAPRDLSLIQSIHTPFLGLYAEKDHSITPEIVSSIDHQLTENGVKHEVHIYPGTEHAFFNDTRPQIYNPEAAHDAWERTINWFRKYLS